MNNKFTKRHENSFDPFIMKYAQDKFTEPELCDSWQLGNWEAPLQLKVG